MNLKKEIQVALNSCQPNTNRVDKVEKIANDYALKFADWYWKKCFISNFDMYMSIEEAFEIFKKQNYV